MGRLGRRHPSRNQLRYFRRLNGFTQKEVEEMLGLTAKGQVSKWEKGLRMPNALNLIQLSAIYRALPNELYLQAYDEFRSTLPEKLDALREKRQRELENERQR
jgi:transcriptional regulator with XRE-family HTH domain